MKKEIPKLVLLTNDPKPPDSRDEPSDGWDLGPTIMMSKEQGMPPALLTQVTKLVGASEEAE